MRLNAIEDTFGPLERSGNPSANDVPVLRRAAMDFLARREHSLFELQQKLSKKFPAVSSVAIDEVLFKLREQNLQSDDRFTEAYVRYRKAKGFGYLHIQAELLSRRVELSILERYLIEDDSDWIKIIQAHLLKKLAGGDSIAYGSKQHRRLVWFLETRGFTPLEIKQALKHKLAT